MNFNRGYALVIGIAQYAEVNGLPDAILNDARDFASVFGSVEYCGFPAANIRLLLNEHATLTAIRSALQELAAVTGPDDTIVLFFSGHGTRLTIGSSESSALVAYDTRVIDLQSTALTENELSTALAQFTSKRLLVFIDACHAGGAGVLKSEQGHALKYGFDEKSLQRLAEGVGRVIMASSRASETSRVMEGARNSIFTEKLLEALKGKARTVGDGFIRVFDVFNYIAEHVTKSASGRQHPIFRASEMETNFPIALESGGAKSLGSRDYGLENGRDLVQIMADLYPAGPIDQDIWARAGGDLSRLKLTGTGQANWFAAVRALKLGGGGLNISQSALIKAALSDFPHHLELAALS